VDNGVTSAALVTVDTGMLFEDLWKSLTQKIEKELGITCSKYPLSPDP
jgi:hypothetical protein